jgi:tubulin---tyrosine ligase
VFQVVNDDGPPSNQASPYVHSLVSTLQTTGHTVSVILPHSQRSWIGKAHIVGQTLTQTYFRPGTLLKDDGVVSSKPFNDGKEEWILVDGTPASCVQIGLYHEFKDRGPVDLVLSGPNFGRNTTAIFALSSGTIGGALEGAVCGKKAIALSYAFDSREHDAEVLAEAAKLSTRLVEKLMAEWPEDVHLYSINVPVKKGIGDAKIIYTEMLQNQWKHGSSFEELLAEEEDLDPAEREKEIREGQPTPSLIQEANGNIGGQVSTQPKKQYKWAPNFADVREAIRNAGSGDGWTVLQGMVRYSHFISRVIASLLTSPDSVTPLKANFWHLPHYKGEIKL